MWGTSSDWVPCIFQLLDLATLSLLYFISITVQIFVRDFFLWCFLSLLWGLPVCLSNLGSSGLFCIFFAIVEPRRFVDFKVCSDFHCSYDGVVMSKLLTLEQKIGLSWYFKLPNHLEFISPNVRCSNNFTHLQIIK